MLDSTYAIQLQGKCTTLQARGVTVYFESTMYIIRRNYVFVQ